jgi:hypothetical protein
LHNDLPMSDDPLRAWERRQRRLNLIASRRGDVGRVVVDGLAGPQTLAMMRRLGFARGLEIDDTVA